MTVDERRTRIRLWAYVAMVAQGLAAPPANVTGLGWQIKPGQVRVYWDPCPDADYAATEIRLDGTSWSDAVFLWRGASNDYKHARPPNGTYLARPRGRRPGADAERPRPAARAARTAGAGGLGARIEGIQQGCTPGTGAGRGPCAGRRERGLATPRRAGLSLGRGRVPGAERLADDQVAAADRWQRSPD